MTAVAGTVVAAKISLSGNGHAAEVSADSNNDEPLSGWSALFVGFRVAQFLQINSSLDGDFLSSTAANKNGFA